MRLKILFEYLIDSFSLLENPLDDYVIMAIIGVIAYLIAYSLVGKLYSYDLIDGRGAGHFLHWIIRFIVFVVIMQPQLLFVCILGSMDYQIING